MTLPPLRTVRDAAGTAPAASPAAGPTAPAARPVPGLDSPRLPSAARTFLAELVGRDLIDADAVPRFLAAVGDRLPQLTTRDRAGDALVAHGLLSRHQRDRALAGQFHGLVFGPYRVVERLGGGSVGPVLLAEHRFLRRKVAVKVLPADDTVPAAVRDRFAAEARLLAGLDHPHVVRVYDAGIAPGEAGQPPLCFAVLELAAGGDVEHFVYANGTQPVAVACEWGRQAAAGLRAAHDAGLVHRDVKPSNLVLTDTRRVKLVDFGLARQFGSTRTPHRVVLGSLDFVAPEQLSAAATAGPAADLYGLGTTLFWVLTGQLPLPAAKTAADAVESRRAGTPRRLREFLPDAPAELDALFDRLLARNPADRPTAGEAAAAFAAFTDGADADQLRADVDQLERAVLAKETDAAAARAAVLTTLAAVAATHPNEPPGRGRRVGGYVRAMAGRLAGTADWPALADPRLVDEVVAAAEARGFGAVTRDGDPLAELAAAHGPALPFLRVVRDVVRQHRETWDGTGGPDGLAADAIAPAARLVAVAVAYDDLRRAGVDHAAAAANVRAGAGRAFDPAVVRAFEACEADCEGLFAVVPDRPAADA